MSKISQELNPAFSTLQQRALVQLFNDIRLQLAALTAKMDADAGITDTNYTSTLAARADAVQE